MPTTYDIAVLGADPAALAAGYWLARQRRSVALLDVPDNGSASALCEWVPRGLFGTAGLPQSLRVRCKARQFTRACYHNVALDTQVEYRSRSRCGYLLRSSDLAKALRSLAAEAGAKVRTSHTPPAIHLGEDSVQLVGTARIRAKLLVVTAGLPPEVTEALALPMRNVPSPSLTVAGLDVPLTDRQAAHHLAQSLHMVSLPDRSELGMFFVVDGVLHLRVISASQAAGNRAAELSEMLRRLQGAGIVPAKICLARARGAVWRPPAGAALEMETHVAKRCLLAGTAGGFADSITGQTLLPSIKSALLAAKIAVSALSSPDPQTTLMGYKTLWRKALADYLRPPNTSLQMLLPLLFANQRIVTRFTRALLFGENI